MPPIESDAATLTGMEGIWPIHLYDGRSRCAAVHMCERPPIAVPSIDAALAACCLLVAKCQVVDIK